MKIIDISFFTELSINEQSVFSGGTSLTQLTRERKFDSTENGPLFRIQYEYRGQLVYYVPPPLGCGDCFSKLYDASGKVLCSPDGGIAGFGDGKCVGFFSEAKVKKAL